MLRRVLYFLQTLMLTTILLNVSLSIYFRINTKDGNYEWDPSVGHRLKANHLVNYEDYRGFSYSYVTGANGYEITQSSVQKKCTAENYILYGDSFLQRNLRPGNNFAEVYGEKLGCRIENRSVSGWSTENQYLDYIKNPVSNSHIKLFLYIGNDFFETNEGRERYSVDPDGHLQSRAVVGAARDLYRDTATYRMLRIVYARIKEKYAGNYPIVKIDSEFIKSDGNLKVSHVLRTIDFIKRFNHTAIEGGNSFEVFVIPSIIDVDGNNVTRYSPLAEDGATPEARRVAIAQFLELVRSHGVSIKLLDINSRFNSADSENTYDIHGGHWTEAGALRAVAAVSGE